MITLSLTLVCSGLSCYVWAFLRTYQPFIRRKLEKAMNKPEDNDRFPPGVAGHIPEAFKDPDVPQEAFMDHVMGFWVRYYSNPGFGTKDGFSEKAALAAARRRVAQEFWKTQTGEQPRGSK